MKVLVVDDAASIRMLTASLIEDMGYEAIEAETGERALEIIREMEGLPDLIVLDIYMPGIDGYETGKQIKAIAGGQHIPIIFLTGAQDEDIEAKCFAIGDDYIAKPFTSEMVMIKVKAHLRVSQLSKAMAEKNLELDRYNKLVRMEHEIVETIFANHFQRHICRADNLRFHISPVSVFNGDVLLTARGPAGNLYIAVGDVTGHGLPAAVGAIPIYSLFRTMAQKGLGVGTIAAEMNRALRGLMPDNMMLAAIIIELNGAGNQLTVWSGGLPDMPITDARGKIKYQIASAHPPLSAQEPHEFSQNVAVFKLEPEDRLYLFTDGVEESRNAEGHMFGEERLQGLFDGQSPDMFDKIISSLENFTEGAGQDDDITLVELIARPAEDEPEQSLVKDRDDVYALPWQLTIRLGPDEVRRAEPIPQIVRLLSNATGLDVHEDFISTILSEFYANALEHGLLKLDSSIKEDPDDGFFRYYQMRRQRLAALSEGEIVISLDYRSDQEGGLVEIEVSDSGEGFEPGQVKSDEDQRHGRGINIIRELCESVTYSHGGSTVKAVYRVG